MAISSYYQQNNTTMKPINQNNLKQTAVAWLLNNLHEIGVNHNLSIKAEKGWLEKRNEIIEQAKAMEKEQIIDANRNGVDMVIDKKPFITGEQYYNETYGK